jgi:hypothetical protein
VRPFLAIILTATAVFAESHPSWWTLAEPDATALVGIQWENLRQSPFAEAIEAELSSAGSLGFPDLPLIVSAKQILISAPSVLAIAIGNFPVDVLRVQASAKGMKLGSYRSVNIWISPGKTTLSVAQISDQLILIGLLKTLQDAVDRSQAETDRRYSPLLARAARLAPGKDLWVVATQLPDPLASLFVPIDAESQGFDGGISVRDGLELHASLDAASNKAAAGIATKLRQSIPTLPAIARTMEVTADAHTVVLTLQVTPGQLSAALHPPAVAIEAAAPQPPPVTPLPTIAVAAAAPPPPEPVKPEPKPEGPQVIRIFGLDEGVREIPLKPKNQ